MSDKPTTAELVKFVRSLNSAITTTDGWVAPGSVIRGLTLDLVADRLEAALPTWTKITDDPDTWPDPKIPIMVMPELDDDPIILIGERIETKPKMITHWRPLNDNDYPPEQQ